MAFVLSCFLQGRDVPSVVFRPANRVILEYILPFDVNYDIFILSDYHNQE